MTDVSRETSGRAEFAAEFDVGWQTLAKFDRYAELLAEWQQRMNLVGPSTLPDIWSRHFADSAQLVGLANEGPWLDIGAGAGFPGLVLSILGAPHVHLVESVTKKAKFLTAVTDELALRTVTVHNVRVESLVTFPVANITARACAPLAKLFEWGLPFSSRSTRWLLPKGATVDDELREAGRQFTFHVERIASITDPRGRIVVAHDVKRRR